MTALAKLATLATLGCALALPACVVEHVDAPATPAAPPVVEPPSTVPAVQLPPGVVNGRPVHFKDGGPEAYWVWRNEHGQYHFRVTAPVGAKTESQTSRMIAASAPRDATSPRRRRWSGPRPKWLSSARMPSR